MENKIKISENKILEHNEKALSDTEQLIDTLVQFNDKDAVVDERLYFDKGRTIWLEMKVEDSFLSQHILSWMFSKSKCDGSEGLQAFGCSLKSIMFSKPSGYSEDEKYAIKKLYEAAFGDNE